MKFKPWIPSKSKSKFAIRFYVEDSANRAFISVKMGALKISNSTVDEELKIRNFLLSQQIDLEAIGIRELGKKISLKGLSVLSNAVPSGLTRLPNVVDFNSKNSSNSEGHEDSMEVKTIEPVSIATSRILELENQLNWLLNKVRVDDGDVYIATGHSKSDNDKSISNIKKIINKS